MTTEELIYAIKQRKSAIYLATEKEIADDINNIFEEMLKHLEKKKWSCYDCMWSSDKCKCADSDQYDKFLQDIEKCKLTGECDNTLGCSWRDLENDAL